VSESGGPLVEIVYSRGRVELRGKTLNALDKFVLAFSRILEKYVDYVIVGGYVAILFGRSRGTEDVDVIVRRVEHSEFLLLYNELRGKGYYFVNPGGPSELYRMLDAGLRVRVTVEGTVIPNFELKFAESELDEYSLDNRVAVVFDDERVYVPPIELQIAYKLYLGGEKDIEDAIYLWEVFKEHLDLCLLHKFMEILGVKGDAYGIG
jgi:hypothetical protein